MKTKGFTLVELLVVIAILAILATVSVVGYTSYIAGAEKTAAETEAASIADAIDVALVMNKTIRLEKTAAVEADAENNVAAADATYIYITRNDNGIGYTVSETPATGVTYADVAEISTELTHRLSIVNNVLTYTSAKNVAVPVK